MEKSTFVGVHRSSVSFTSRSKGLNVLRATTERGHKNLWTPFLPAGWHSEFFDRLFPAMGYEDWHGSSETLYQWRGTDSELVTISLRLDSAYKIAPIRAIPDDFAAVRDAVTLLMPDGVEFEFSVNLRYGVLTRDAFRDFTIISSRVEPPPGLEELPPIAQKVDRLLERAAETVWAQVREQQQPALAAIRQRIERF